MRVVVHADGAGLLRHAGAMLAAAEAENNLLLGLCARPLPGAYLATVDDDAGAHAAAMWTGPAFKLAVSRAAEPALRALVADVRARGLRPPGVLSDATTARTFARLWGGPHHVAMRQRIYELEHVVPPPQPAGKARPAVAADQSTVAAWIVGFAREAQIETRTKDEARDEARHAIEAGGLWLWEDGVPVAMANAGGLTPTGARINYVFTPPDRRCCGYATALVAALSQATLDRGRRRCFLYTDLDNPTSNAIYQRIGYRPVTDVLALSFTP